MSKCTILTQLSHKSVSVYEVCIAFDRPQQHNSSDQVYGLLSTVPTNSSCCWWPPASVAAAVVVVAAAAFIADQFQPGIINSEYSDIPVAR